LISGHKDMFAMVVTELTGHDEVWIKFSHLYIHSHLNAG
jgi:hypothetical protein